MPVNPAHKAEVNLRGLDDLSKIKYERIEPNKKSPEGQMRWGSAPTCGR